MGIRIAYRKINGGAELVRLWGDEDVVVVPKKVEGVGLTAIAPYAFSSHKDKEDEDVSLWEAGEEETIFGRTACLRCGGNVREIHLPETVQMIGNYAFYGCMNLQVFHVTDRVTRMGSGVFTGCRLSRVAIDFYDGEKSCLKEILTEIRYRITATLHFGCQSIRENNIMGKDSAAKEGYMRNAAECAGILAKVVFPEYYADAVENTPARIVETHYYGSGGDYRECFYRRELDFLKYDSMFALSAARDHGEVTALLALGRLLYPYRLSEKARARYEAYVKAHMGDITEYCLEYLREGGQLPVAEPLKVIDFCCREHYYTEETLAEAIEKTAKERQMEMLSVLMDERYRQFPKKKKKFEL
ncbi:leucine-rich repeat protein [Roseburia hominis]